MTKLISTNPAKNYEVIGFVNVSTPYEIKQKVAFAQKVKTYWKELGVAKRVKLLEPIYKRLIKDKDELAHLITKEIGKPIKQSLDDIEWDISFFKSWLENGAKYLKDEVTYEDQKQIHKIVYEPLGVAAAIAPWNYPCDMFLWGVIPNLIAGNPVVFKHSEETPLTGKKMEEIMGAANLPKGVFSEVYGDSEVGRSLVGENVDFIWFTGSSKVGKSLYEIAGKKFIKVILEMGGSNPAIVFDDINIDKIIDKIYDERFQNCGQVCDALKRLIVHKSKIDEVVAKLKKKVEEKKLGDPENLNTDIGSLVAKRQLELLESQVKDAIKKGAKVITGGKRPGNLEGAYYQPTILTSIKQNMRVWKEETFGPVLVVVPFSSEEEAIKLANDTNYGLGAIVFTSDKERAWRVASKIKSGTVEVNLANHWLACNPFGGYKESGMGREHGKYGFLELTQLKIISMEK